MQAPAANRCISVNVLDWFPDEKAARGLDDDFRTSTYVRAWKLVRVRALAFTAATATATGSVYR